jgi:RNA polymerase sigma-70 factor, ECF subfamily
MPVPDSTDGRSSRFSEEDWPARVRAGDARAFEAMFKAYYDPLCRYIVGYLGSRDEAEDVVEDLFARIWRERERWQVHGPLRPYLLTAVRCGAINRLRHEAVRRRAAPLLSLYEAQRSQPAIADAGFESEELRRRIERTLATLPPRTREAFLLRRGEGLSYDEVAFRMGISHKTVGVHIGRALAALRKAVLLLLEGQ